MSVQIAIFSALLGLAGGAYWLISSQEAKIDDLNRMIVELNSQVNDLGLEAKKQQILSDILMSEMNISWQEMEQAISDFKEGQ